MGNAMSDILNELLTDIISLGEATPPNKKTSAPKTNAADIKPRSAKFTSGGRWYSDANFTNYVGRVVGGKWVAATPKEKQAEREKQTQQLVQKPAADDTDSQTQSIEKKISNTRNAVKKESLLHLLKAIQSGDLNTLQDTINDLKLVISPEGKLKAKIYSGDDQKIAGDDREFARNVYDLAKQVGVEISGGVPREDSEQEPPSKLAERFKPSALFKNENLDKLDLQTTDLGIVIEGTELNIVSDADITTAEDNWIERARQFKSSRGEEFTPEYEQNVRRYVRGIYAKANHNIRYMRKLAESGEELGTYEFRGEEGKDVIVKNLTTAITQYVGNQQQLTPILSALQKMKSTKGVREFNSAYEEFSTALQGTPIESSKKYIVESLTAIRTIATGGVAIIPNSDAFKLADVVSIRQNPFTGDLSISQFLVDIDEEQTVSAAGSVKQGRGNASSNEAKIENSEFKTGEVDGVDCSSVKEELLSLCKMRNEIFRPNDGDVPIEAKQKILTVIQKYIPMIQAYYGLEVDMTDEQIYEFLSYGKELVCVDGKPAPALPNKKTGEMKPYNQASSPNGNQWRAWSVLGKVTDAIHNRTVRYQFYDTIRYNGKITTADGIRRFSKMEAQHLKNKMNVKGKPGFTKPDQELNAFTKPATVAETRNGNPCTQ